MICDVSLLRFWFWDSWISLSPSPLSLSPETIFSKNLHFIYLREILFLFRFSVNVHAAQLV